MLMAAALPVFLPQSAAAHPHVWVDVRGTFRFNGSGDIQAIEALWRFDDLYSAFALQGLDVDGDGSYTPQEMAPLKDELATSLPPYGYFTTLTVDGRQQRFAQAIQLDLSADRGVLQLELILPLDAPIDPRKGSVVLTAYDPSYYVALDLTGGEVVGLDGTVPDGCRAVVEPPRASGRQPTLSDDLATNIDLARSYAVDFAPSVHVACS